MVNGGLNPNGEDLSPNLSLGPSMVGPLLHLAANDPLLLIHSLILFLSLAVQCPCLTSEKYMCNESLCICVYCEHFFTLWLL